MIDDKLKKALEMIERFSPVWKWQRFSDRHEELSFCLQTPDGQLNGSLAWRWVTPGYKYEKGSFNSKSDFVLTIGGNLFYGHYPKYKARAARGGFLLLDKVTVYDEPEEYKFLVRYFEEKRRPFTEPERRAKAEAEAKEAEAKARAQYLKDKYFGK
jgi:hypothetical protein